MDNQTKKAFLEAIKDMSDETDECFKDIMSGPQQLKQSIQQFNNQLTQLTDSVLNNNDIELDLNKLSQLDYSLHQNCWTNESRSQWLKVIVPNLTKKFSIHMNTD